MYKIPDQDILRCEQCKKPFDKESSLKRHRYYCRARKTVAAPRSRSCRACANSKARCDNRRPECSRCVNRAFECHYPAKSPRKIVSRAQPLHQSQVQCRSTDSLATISPNAVHPQEASHDGDIDLHGTLATSDLDLLNTGQDFLNWDSSNFYLGEVVDLQMPTDLGVAVRCPSPTTSSINFVLPAPNVQAVEAPSSIHSALSIPRSPTSTLRTLIQRPKLVTGTQKIANLMLQTLRSFPLMLLRDDMPPPFIHPSLISADAEDDSIELLANSISLLYVIKGGIQGSRKLFWRNVQVECDRVCAEHSKFNKWELLAALQALLIYILIRLDEGETDYNNLDTLLVTSVIVVSKQLARDDITCSTPSKVCDHGPPSSWKNWLLMESIRRVSVIYQVLGMLFYFDPAALCDHQTTDLILAPLPAKRQLWEAGDEASWRAEIDKEVGVQNDFALSANGELVKLDKSQPCCADEVALFTSPGSPSVSPETENWTDWCAGMDSLGGLILLAAALVG